MHDSLYARLDDNDLWIRFIDGDVKVLEELYTRYFDLLLNYGLKCWPDQELIKDCIQDLFVNLHVKRNLKRTLYVRPYLLKSLRNILFNKLREIKHTESIVELSFQIAFEDTGLKEIFHQNDEELNLSRRLAKGISTLSENQRTALYLRYVKEFSYKEIADTLNITSQSSMNLVGRALKKLRSEVGNLILLFFL